MSASENNMFVDDELGRSLPTIQSDVGRRNLPAVLWRHRWLLFASLSAALAIGGLYMRLCPASYTATSRLYVAPVGGRLLDPQSTAGQMGLIGFATTQRELIGSRPVLANALQSMDTTRMKTFANVTDPLQFCRQNLKVELGSDNILSVSFTSPIAKEAQRIANAVVDSYVTWQSEQKRRAAGAVLQVLAREKEKIERLLAERTKAMVEYKTSNGTLSFRGSEDGNFVLQRLSALSDALTKAQIETISTRAACEAAKDILAHPAAIRLTPEGEHSPEAIASVERDIRTEQAALAALRLKLSSVSGKFADQHPSVVALQQQIDQTKANLAVQERSLAQTHLDLVQNRLVEAQKREDEVQRLFEKQQKTAMEMNQRGVEYARLETDMRRTERLCDSVDNQMKEVALAENAGALNSISVFEPAPVPDTVSFPNLKRTLAYATVAGLMLGLILALLRERLDKRFRSSVEIAAHLNLPVVGVLPQVPNGNRLGSLLIDSCRTVRLAVQHGTGYGNLHRLLISSPVGGEGRSSVAASLAIAMAQAGQRVLLMDVNIRRPVLHQLFALREATGLFDLFDANTHIDAVVRETAVAGLDLLPAGSVPENSLSLLAGPRFVSLMDELSQRYDCIVMDSPPAGDPAVTSVLASVCDTTLLVLKADSSTSPAAMTAVEELSSVGAHVLGVIVNGAPMGSGMAVGAWRCCYGKRHPRKQWESAPNTFSLSSRQAPTTVAA